MKKQKILYFIILFIALAVVMRLAAPSKSAGPQKIDDVIWKMFSSAKNGDVQQYLDCFTGQPLAALQAAKEERGSDGFAEYIRQNTQNVKGLSIINGKEESPKQALFEVEVVYADKNECQTVSLENTSGGWKIREVLKPALVNQPIPYMKQVVE